MSGTYSGSFNEGEQQFMRPKKYDNKVSAAERKNSDMGGDGFDDFETVDDKPKKPFK